MKIQKSKAFTLVELIVVITILAILGTIAFISFQGYSKNSRDSKRIAEINNIQKSLGIYIVEKGTYPIPDNSVDITYSGAIVWMEGTIGSNVRTNIKNISKIPIDPLTSNEYTYSVTLAKTEYQIGAISEGGQMGFKLPINQTYAATINKGTAVIKGTYNEKFVKVQSGTQNWILALPSIIVTDITQTDLQTILNNKKLVYNNYSNIPHSYNNMGYTMTGGFDYTNSNPLIYSGSIKNLVDNDSEKLTFITKLKSAYNGTILQGEANYKDIINSDTATNSTGAINTVISFINSNVGGLKASNTVLPLLSSNGTSEPQLVQFLSNCTANGQIYYADNSGDKLATVTNAGVATWETGKSISDLTCAGHIIVCNGNNAGYTLQTCNLGSSTVGATNNSSAYGNRYQFGEIDNSWIDGNSLWNYDWKTPGGTNTGSANDWGVLDANKTTATWLNSDSTSKTKMQGPCSSGYHIPTSAEWVGIYTAGLWGSTLGTNLSNTLKMPLAGYRLWNNGTMQEQGAVGRYWSSSPIGRDGFDFYFHSFIDPTSYYYRSYGFSIRCIKN